MAKTTFIRIEGGRELRRDLKRAGRDDLRDALKAGHKEIAEVVADEAKRRAPKQTARLARSIKGKGTLAGARVQAGSKSVPYAAVIQFGWPARNIEPNRYINDAVEEKMPEVRKIYEARMADIVDKFNRGSTT